MRSISANKVYDPISLRNFFFIRFSILPNKDYIYSEYFIFYTRNAGVETNAFRSITSLERKRSVKFSFLF